ncbi:hypothetical protein POSPLADRAFT_1186393 [Postia placenta MAD-698-R-SB12]|uniref:Zn(2)-C6 fungal-type domain-containing protein n=1 Tax=Postia placenta MAD-698-R-SB12 TaxID=670580 RepID=A0A1X6MKB8_9APHY|nr:hypothetical protein POSPLADRAFT_1186393 [Postia placenta MAD-698-R-SB12]OSX56834.1 hypothetical protein POSPLADRAFT_1186393 [Postia placenta MAD-698-R-SB12]
MSSFPVDPAHADNTSPPDSASTDQHHSEGAANGEQDNDGPGKKKKGPKRRKVNHACLYCRRSHMTCDEGRPCQRCIKREIGHLCHDERRSSVKEKTPTPGSSSIPNPPVDVARALPGSSPFGSTPIAPTTMNPAWPGMGMAQGAFLYQPEALNEFSVLSDFLESLDDGSFFGQPNGVGPSLMSPTPYNSTVLGVDNPYISNERPASPAEPAPAAPEKPPAEPAPVVLPAATKTERFFLTAADQASGSRNERLNMVIRSKYEAGLLKPYNYVKGYARLSRWMDKNVSLESKQKILQPLSVLRPKFRAIAQSESLTDIDLVFIEEAFERLLLDYDRVFSAMAIPACLWRRTGEIYKANREFAELVGVDGYMLRDGRLCIYELMAEDSAVNYWEKYGNVAFDSNQKAVLTSCVLRYKPSLPSSGATTPSRRSTQTPPKEEGFISCCFSFTIRRDPYGIPTLIVGNFIKC